MSTPLIKEFDYNASIEQVWQALTDVDKMKQWYFPQLQQFEPIVGYQFQFADEDSAYQKEWVVTEVKEARTLAHSWAYKGYAGSSQVIFELFANENTTRLKVTQTAIESFPAHADFKRERFEWGWDLLLGQNLRQLLDHSNKS
jgi:uncharacterized protein YndB with AHSA1/START domain